MKKNILFGCILLLLGYNTMQSQGFTSPAIQWNIPINTDTSDYRASWDYHQLIDMNGDGKVDYVDTEDQATESTYGPFLNGGQKYWKVYLSNGSGFSATAIQWNIPISSDTSDHRLAWDYHNVIDMNGDLKPDFVDTEDQSNESTYGPFLNGGQKYWKVYLNNGAGFDATATQWNIPINTDTSDYRLAWDYHNVIDMNGDMKPDFIDTEDQANESTYSTFLNGGQKYWKVYLNTGSGFSATATQWNIPISSDTSDYRLAWDYHTVIDMNGDMKPDYVDTEDQSTESTYGPFLNGGQKYWKVYLNTGSGFSASATQWNIPISTDTSDYRLAWDYHALVDMNGDLKPEFVDTEDQSNESTYSTFLNGGQKYWKVYMNNGSGFDAAATQWNIPISTDTSDYRLAWDYHQVIDMDGDKKPDFLDTEDQANESTYSTFLNGSQKYWKVYSNNAPSLATEQFQLNSLSIYPNPVNETFRIGNDVRITAMKIYDIKGVMIKEITNGFDNGINVSDLQQGIYLLKATAVDGGIFTQRIVKQ